MSRIVVCGGFVLVVFGVGFVVEGGMEVRGMDDSIVVVGFVSVV